MGLFDKLKSAIGEGIAQGISDAIGKAIQEKVAPAAEQAAENVAEHITNAAESASASADAVAASADAAAEAAAKDPDVWNRLAEALEKNSEVFANAMENAQAEIREDMEARSKELEGCEKVLMHFPAWTLCPITRIYDPGWDEYDAACVCVQPTEAMVDQYQALLKAGGFTGDWQLMHKTIDGKECTVDFTFALSEGEDCSINFAIEK